MGLLLEHSLSDMASAVVGVLDTGADPNRSIRYRINSIIDTIHAIIANVN